MATESNLLHWHSTRHKSCHPTQANALVCLLFCRFGTILVIFSVDTTSICKNNRTFGIVFAHKTNKLHVLPQKEKTWP